MLEYSVSDLWYNKSSALLHTTPKGEKEGEAMRLAIVTVVIAAILFPLVVLVKRRFWDLYAVCYDAISVLIPYRQMMADLVESMKLQPNKAVKVLVLGCGTGNFEKLVLAEAIKVSANIEIVGADFSTSMLKRACQVPRF